MKAQVTLRLKDSSTRVLAEGDVAGWVEAEALADRALEAVGDAVAVGEWRRVDGVAVLELWEVEG